MGYFHIFADLDIFHVHGLAHIQIGNIDRDGLGDGIGQAKHFQFATDDLKHATHFHTHGLSGGDHGHMDTHLAGHIHFIKIDVDEAVIDRMNLQFLDHGGLGFFAAIDRQVDHCYVLIVCQVSFVMVVFTGRHRPTQYP